LREKWWLINSAGCGKGGVRISEATSAAPARLQSREYKLSPNRILFSLHEAERIIMLS